MAEALASPRRGPFDDQPINRYWDPVHKVQAAKILPGQFYISGTGETIVTVLGSCVSACVRDPESGAGGMNHFMLPDEGRPGSEEHGPAGRYGQHAMEELINGILRLGGRRERLEVKLVGGGRVLDGATDIGARNIAFARRFLDTDGLHLVAEDLGGHWPRKVYYFPDTGRLRIKRLSTLNNDTISRREAEYQKRLSQEPSAGSVELF